MNQLTEFGNCLKAARESRAMSIGEIARVTKIPERSLQLMEDGRFSGLPGEVFARGFLRSYARCVGLDPEDTVRRYGALGGRGDGAPRAVVAVPPALSAGPAASAPGRGEAAPRPVVAAAMAATSVSVVPFGGSAVAVATAPGGQASASRTGTHDISVIARSLLEAGLGPRRATLTLAVIILVIVATLTLSLLLRRPSHVGDGVSVTHASPAAII